MSLNNIILPDVLLSNLYKNHLVQIPEAKQDPHTAQPVTVTPPPVQFLGKHLQQIAVYVHYPNEVHLPDAQLNFLANILKACYLNIADIAIVNLAKQEMQPQRIPAALNSRKLIFFEVTPSEVGMDDGIPSFSVKPYKEVLVLRAPALEKLNQGNEEGKLLKSKLWLCLKELFSVER